MGGSGIVGNGNSTIVSRDEGGGVDDWGERRMKRRGS